MPDISGDFLVPPSAVVPGGILVYDWAKCRLLVDKTVIPDVMSMSCMRSADISAGIATIKLLDVNKEIYDSIQTGQEVEIYLSEQSPMTYGNKVWGGYLESREFDVNNKIVLILKAKEYSNILIRSFTADTAQANKNSFTGIAAGTAIKALMSNYQLDFTSDNVTVVSADLITADYLNQNLFDSIKSICDQFGYVFYINLDKDLVVRPSTTVVETPATDYLTYTENMNSISQEDNKEFLCNDLIVYGASTGVVSNSGSALQDANSIAAYGQYSKRLYISSLTTSADCTTYANAYLAIYKNPIQEYKTVSRLIANSEPLQYIPVTASQANLSDSYQIREMSHYYDKKGIRTEMTLDRKVVNLSMTLGQLLSEVRALQAKNYV